MVTITCNEKRKVKIVSGASKVQLFSADPQDFPPIPSDSSVVMSEIPSASLALMIDRTEFSISQEETRPALGGVCLEYMDGKTVRMVSTDGHRLSVADYPVATPINLPKPVLIPRKGLKSLRKLLSESENPCLIGFSARTAFFKQNNATLQIQLLVSPFPAYREVVPKTHSRTATIDRMLLLQALRRVALLTDSKTKALRFAIGEKSVGMFSESSGLGEAHEDVDAVVEGKPMTTGFNATYLTDVLSVLSCDQVRFELGETTDAGVLRPVGDDNYFVVLMPMRF
jgi:DNA polymerase-3 subunit beta